MNAKRILKLLTDAQKTAIEGTPCMRRGNTERLRRKLTAEGVSGDSLVAMMKITKAR